MTLLGHGAPVIDQIVMVLLPWCHLSIVDSKWAPKHFYDHCYCSESQQKKWVVLQHTAAVTNRLQQHFSDSHIGS